MKSNTQYSIESQRALRKNSKKVGASFLLSIFVCIGFFWGNFSYAFSRDNLRCVELILTDNDLGIYSSREASKVCSQYYFDEVRCAQRLDNQGIEDDFLKGLKVCEKPRQVACVELILTDDDLGIYSSREASEICSRYTMSEVRCAQSLDNQGIEDDFLEGLRVCEKPQTASCVELILRDDDLGIYSSREASRICSRYTMSEVRCAQRLDNQGIEDDFLKGLRVCEKPRQVACVKLILTDNDLGIYSSRKASEICSRYTMSEVRCAQRLDNQGIEDEFLEALNLCNLEYFH